MLTAQQILSSKKCGDLFSSADKQVVTAEYREIARAYHPDISSDPQANEVMAKVNQLYEEALKLIESGAWEVSNRLILRDKSGKKYIGKYLKQFPFELGEAYIANSTVTYALQFGGMRPQFRRGHDYSDRIWGALERRPESAALVSDLRRAASQAGIQAQAQDAAFLAGYLEAFGEFKEFVDYLSAEKKVNAEFRQQIDRLLDRQMEKYFTFAEQINTPERYDGGHDETAISGRTLDCEGGAKDGV